jgi:hypothetical protein
MMKKKKKKKKYVSCLLCYLHCKICVTQQPWPNLKVLSGHLLAWRNRGKVTSYSAKTAGVWVRMKHIIMTLGVRQRRRDSCKNANREQEKKHKERVINT